MPNTTSPQDFEIHVDPSCLSESSDKFEHPTDECPKADPIEQDDDERVSSNQTMAHDESSNQEEIKAEQLEKEELMSVDGSEEDHKENMPAAPSSPLKATVEDAMSEDEAQPEPTETDQESAARERQLKRIQAQIHAAAKAVVANIEHDHYNGVLDSELSMPTDENYGRDRTEMTCDSTGSSYDNGTELTYGDETEATLETDNDHHSSHPDEGEQKFEVDRHSEQGNEDSSDHHDADIDDDVFSHSASSKRSSMNSDPHSSDDNQKMLTSPKVGEEAGSNDGMDVISRVPSGSSYILQMAAGTSPRTPSKVLSRPPFRTPSSVRAMQMSSPTQSVFSAPRSSKRQMPTVSRVGTPNSQYSPFRRTPIRFKEKKEPLVLLHVTVLPLQWTYSHLMSSPEIPTSLQTVKESWRLLQGKLGDTVFERGVLLAHPQDSYEMLEERLLEALELPVRPRAKILRCGHYMGPGDSESPSSDEEGGRDTWTAEGGEQRKWCDICMRDVRLETVGDVEEGERKFRVKIYASNGLMRAGAWAACWREMERVDVELEPYVETHQHSELEHLALIAGPLVEDQKEEDHGFEDEDEVIEHIHDHDHEAEAQQKEEDRLQKEAERLQEEQAKLHEEEQARKQIALDEEARLHEEEQRKQLAEDEAMRLHEEEQMRKQMELEEELRQKMVEEEELIRKNQEEQRMNETYDSRRSTSRNSVHDDSSLPELLLAAFKVAMRDSRNVAIGVLSVLVLLLALRPRGAPEHPKSTVMMDVAPPMVQQITTTVFKEASITAKPVPVATIEQVVQAVRKPVEREPVTTTIYREFTVTERIPTATPVAIENPPKILDPCDPSLKAKNTPLPGVETEVERDEDLSATESPMSMADAQVISEETASFEEESQSSEGDQMQSPLADTAEKLLTPLESPISLESDHETLPSDAATDPVANPDVS